MVWKVRAYFGKTWWQWSHPTKEGADSQVETLRTKGLWSRSKAGVVTWIFPHRIHRVTVRQVQDE